MADERGGGYVSLRLWIGEKKKPDEGYVIPNEAIDAIEITENMFTMLPTMYLQISDSGNLAFRKLIRTGDTLCISMAPDNIADDEGDNTVKPYVVAEYCIQSIKMGLSENGDMYVQKIFCVYNAQSYLNEIVTYPVDDITNLVYLKKTSIEVIQQMLDGTSMGFSPAIKTDDKSYWLNCNETRAKFIERLTQHAWVEEGDAPITFTDLNGIMHLDSIGNMVKMPTLFNCAYASPTMSEANESGTAITTVIMSDAQQINAAQPILNQGGYKLQYSIYNPYNEKVLNRQEFPKWGSGGALGNAAGAVTSLVGSIKDPSNGFRSAEYGRKDPFLATVQNKRSCDFVSDNIDGGMHYDELHEHYTIAPKHNENVRRSFFQNFVGFTIDTSRQGAFFQKPDYRPRLGGVVHCDFGNDKGPDALHSGKYVICKIKHRYQKKLPYVIEITGVNDGYYSMGS